MANQSSRTMHRRLALLLGAAGISCGALAFAQDYFEPSGPGPIGAFYSHSQDEYPSNHLGDVPPDLVEPRSLADTRVRQFDELDRPRYAQRMTHRGAQRDAEHFTVVATTGDADAQFAQEEFARAWDEFGALADTFTQAHRNPDFALGQLLIVIDDAPTRERDEPVRNLQVQNGQIIVYINVAEGQPPLEEQVNELRQGAAHAMMHLAELDRKFPVWVQQGLAEYTAQKLEKRDEAEATRQQDEGNEGFDPDTTVPEEMGTQRDEVAATEEGDDYETTAPERDAVAGTTQIGTEYWRLQRRVQDALEEPEEQSEQLVRVQFLLEGDDAAHAPEFLLALRDLAEEPTDPRLASRAELRHTQLLPAPTDTPVDELMEELDDDFLAWQADPLRGQPLFLPGGDIPDAGMLSREKEMEVVLKLAQRVARRETVGEIQPRITEFDAGGQRVVETAQVAEAIDVEQLYYELRHSETPWATVDTSGNLLLWTDEDRLAETLGVEEDRFTSQWRDGRWVLVTVWDDTTQLEAWLEPNENNPSRPLVKFTSRARESMVRVAELEERRR